MAELLRRAVPGLLKRGEDAVEEGQPADSFFLVDAGHLSVTVSNHRGESVMLAVLTRGDHFGELALVDETAVRSATVTALGDARVLEVSRPDFLALRVRQPDFDRAMTAMLAAQIRRLSGQVLDSRLLDVETKVRRQLAILAHTFEKHSGLREEGEASVIPLTQEEIAQLAGVGRQSANKVIRQLEREGAVRLGRRSVEVAPAVLADSRGSR